MYNSMVTEWYAVSGEDGPASSAPLAGSRYSFPELSHIEHTLVRKGAERLWTLTRTEVIDLRRGSVRQCLADSTFAMRNQNKERNIIRLSRSILLTFERSEYILLTRLLMYGPGICAGASLPQS
jgi:hypothetical protein